ncbi:MAG: hypothetical protein M3P44_06610 [Actinomycetota bacterium]|nr:hypothetical protein [Actinomycetota bacterium]
MSHAGVNPFVYDDPVGPGELIDREAEAAQLLNLAIGGHNTRLSAPRRFGKTSLLLKVMDDARDEGLHAIFVDFYGAVAVHEIARRVEEAYLRDLGGPVRRAVANVLRTLTVRVTPGGIGAEMAVGGDRRDSAQGRLAAVLDLPKRVFERSGRRTLVVFDEFQDPLRAEGGLDGLIRSKIQFHRDEASYVFAGSEPGLLEQLFGDRRRPLFDQARPVALGPLGDVDLAEAIAARFEATGRDAGEALDPLLDLVRGHPQRSMLLAHHLWEHTERGAEADADAFADALASVDRELKERFQQTWQSLGRAPNQRRVLLALAQGDASLYSRRTLETFGLDKGGAGSGLRGLVSIGEVRTADDGPPRIVDPLLERWAAAR